MKRHTLLLLFIIGALQSWGYNAEEENKTELLFPNLIIRRDNYDRMKADIERKGNNSVKTAFINFIKTPATNLVENDAKTTTAISTANNANNVDIKTEMQNIYKLCVAYAFLQEESYLQKAVEYLEAWAAVNVAVSRSNIHESVYTDAVEGYSLIRRVVSETTRHKVDAWIQKRADVFLKDNDLRVNNWGTCLLQQFYFYGLAIDNQSLIDHFNSKYPYWAPSNLYPNGTTTDLLGRDAFAYHAYDLLFFAQICHAKACYEDYESADRFYAQDVHWGASIKRSVDFWKPYLLDPAKNVHFEFVETEWAPDKTRGDYNKPYSPAGTMYVVDELYEMDRELIKAIDKYRGGNQFATWALMLSALRWHYEE